MLFTIKTEEKFPQLNCRFNVYFFKLICNEKKIIMIIITIITYLTLIN